MDEERDTGDGSTLDWNWAQEEFSRVPFPNAETK